MTVAAGRPQWCREDVGGVSTHFAVAGHGRPVLFLHGWGIGHRTYSRSLAILAGRGCQVYAPSLPGFGGTAALPRHRRDLAGYVSWLESFVGVVGVDELPIVVGHSLGGTIAVGFSHRRPEVVRYLVLVNAGGATSRHAFGRPGYIGGRPVWSWALQMAHELLPPAKGVRLLESAQADIAANLPRQPLGSWELSQLVNPTDPSSEAADLRAMGVSVLALQGHALGVVPLAALDALCAAIGAPSETASEGESLLLADPAVSDLVSENLARLASSTEAPAPSCPPE